MHITQLAYYVSNARAAAEHWVAAHNAGPFYIAEHIALENVVYNGTPTTLDHTSAYGWCGGLMIELVQQNCSNASVFSNRRYGLHHCARFASDLTAELKRLDAAGHATAMTANTASGLRFAFVDGNPAHHNPDGTGANERPAPMGHYIELYEDQPGIRDFYAMVEGEAKTWNGKEPLRSL